MTGGHDMKGRISVLFAPAGEADAFADNLRAYATQAAASDICLYVDLYFTKHANKFLLVEMYKGDAVPRENESLSVIFGALMPESRREFIYPVYSDPPMRRRPLTEPFDSTVFGGSRYISDAPFGAFAAAYILPGQEEQFLRAIGRVGEKVSAKEPGFLYADMYRTDTPQRYLMVEVYASKAMLWGHQDFAHTKAFAQEKKQYEASKISAFTIRPAFSCGALARVHDQARC